MKSIRKPLATSVAALVAILSTSSASAATGDWNIDNNTTGWQTPGNWAGGIIPDAIDDVANFGFDITAARTVNLNGFRTLGSMTVGDPTTAFFGYTFTANGQGGALVFDTSAGNATLTLAGASTAGSAFNVPIQLNDSLNIHSLNTAVNTFNGNISGLGALIIDAGGTHPSGTASTVGQVTFTGINTFTGGVTISESRVHFANVLSAGSGTITVNDGGQIYLNTAGYYRNNIVLNTLGWTEPGQGQLGAIRAEQNSTLAGSITLAGTSRLAGTGNTTLVNGVIGETGGSQSLEINRLFSGGAGTNSAWVFNNTNTYTGKTTVYAGTLRVGNGGTTGSLGATSGVELGNATLEFRRSDNVTVSTPFTQLTGTIGGVAVTGSNFVHSGTGVLTLDNGASGYLGSTTVNGLNAKLVIGSGGAYQFAGTGNIAISNGADIEFKTSSDIQIGGGANPAAQVFTAAPNSFLIQSGTGTITLGGTADNNNGRAIVNSGTLLFDKSLTGFRALGASNELGLIINNGTVRYGANAHTDQIYLQTDVQINGGTFDLSGKSDGFDILTGNGGIVTNSDISAFPSTLTLGEQNSAVNFASPIAYNATYGGVIQDGTGTVAVTKIGTGIQTLSGANTYTGGTLISAGTLSVTGSLASTGGVSVNTSGTLSGTGSVGDVNLAFGGSIRPGATGSDTSPGTLTMNSLIVNGGDIRMNLGAANDQLVVTTVADFAGSSTITPTFSTLPLPGITSLLSAPGGLTMGVAPTLTVPATTRSTFALAPSLYTLDLVVSGSAAKSLTWTGATSGAWDLNTTANFNGGGAETFYNLDAVTFGDGPSNRTVTLAAGLVPTSITVNNSVGNDYTFQTGTLVGGGTSISKSGTGTLNLNTANAFGGAVSITNGILKAGNAAALGDAGGGTTVSGTGTLDLNALAIGNEPLTISGTGFNGAGTLINSNTVTAGAFRFLTLAGDATIGGPGRLDVGNGNPGLVDLAGFKLTKVGNGIIYLANGGSGVSITSGDIDVQGGTLGFAFAGGVIGGTGTLTYGPGTTGWFYQTTAGNITRSIVVNNATFQTQAQAGAVGSHVTLAGNLTVNDTGGTLTLAGAISESTAGRSIIKANAGALNLNGNNTFTGGITSTGGTITLAGTNAITGPISLTGSTLNVTETMNTTASLGTPSSVSLSGSTLRFTAFGNHTLPAITMSTTSGSTIVFAGQTPDASLTLNTTVGSTTALNALSIEQGRVTLASGANVTVGATNVGLTLGTTGNVGTLNVQAGAALTTGTLYIGEGGFTRSGVVNQTGGTVNVLGSEVTTEGAFRIGHWDGSGSTYNLLSGTLNVPNSTSSIGIDGINAFLNISGGTANLYRLVVDGRGATTPIGGTLNLSGGELSIGTGGLAANAGSQVNWSGGTLSSHGLGTWSAPMHLAGSGLTIDTKGTNVLLSGLFTGPSGFTKTGNGTLTMSNGGVSMTGPIDVNGGTLSVTGLLTGVSAVNVNSGGSIAGNGNGTTTGRITNLVVNSGGFVRPGVDGSDASIGTITTTTMNFNGGTLRPSLSTFNTAVGGTANDFVNVTGQLTLNGGNVMPIWSAPPSPGTYTLMSAGTLAVGTLPTIHPSAFSRLSYVVGTTASSLTLDVSGSTLDLFWSGNPGSNTWDHNNSLNWQYFAPDDELFFAYDNVTFDDINSTASTVNMVGTLLPGFITVDTANTYTFSGTGSIGSGTLLKRGPGTLIVANDNTTTGTATVEFGTLQLGTGGATGGIGNVSIVNLGSVVFNRSGVVGYGDGAVISSFGSVVKDGPGTLAFTGASDAQKQTYTGGTTVTAGLLTLSGSNTGTGVIRGDVSIHSGATLRLLTSNALGYTSGAKVNVININGGTLEQAVGGDNGWGVTYNLTGGTMLSNGGFTNAAGQYFSIGGDNTVGSSRINSFASATPSIIAGRLNLRSGGADGTNHFFTVENGAAEPDLNVSAAITQAAAGYGIVKEGAGSMLLSGAVTASGNITGSNGLLTISGLLNNAPSGLVINGPGIIEITSANGFGGNSLDGATGVSIASRPAAKTALVAVATGTTVTVASTADLKIGMAVNGGANVPAGARIASVTNATTFELSVPVINTGIAAAGALNFGPAPMLLNGGTFRYAGPAVTDDRIINLNTAGGTLDASGTGALTLNGPIGVSGEAGARTLTLTGSSTGGNLLAGLVADNGGATSLLKTGAGAWRLSGANTFTGNTVVSTGELRISAAAALGVGNVTLGDANTGSASTSLYLDAARVSFVRPTTISNNGTGTMTLGSRSTVTGSGNNNFFQNIILERDVIFDSNAADRTDYRTISGTGNITVTGTGRTIFGTVNTFQGNLTLSTTGAGSFQIGAATAGNQNYIPDTTSVSVSAGSRFAVSVGGETIDALSGTGLVNVNSINAILTVGASGGSGVFGGVIANATQTLGITKIGTGTQVLSGINTYTGLTTVSNGTLDVTGSISGSVTTVAGTLAALTGTGVVGPVTLTSGTVTAGSVTGGPIGTLSTGNLMLNGGTALFELEGSTSDQLNVTGTVAFGALVELVLSYNSDLPFGTAFKLINNDLTDSLNLGSGGFAMGGMAITPGVDFSYDSGGSYETFQLSYTAGDGNDTVLTVVPEPGAMMSLLGGLGMLLALRRRKRA